MNDEDPVVLEDDDVTDRGPRVLERYDDVARADTGLHRTASHGDDVRGDDGGGREDRRRTSRHQRS